ncbi:MAG TPA: condensation domain-containing protein [Actinophytocola sp.]
MLELNVSQLRNLRNWARADLPSMVLTAVVPVESTVTAAMTAVGELVRAHEGLRSRLVTASDGALRQEVLPPDAVEVRRHLELIECVDPLTGPEIWATLPVSPLAGAFRTVLYTRDGQVVAIKLSLSHVFVDALGKQAAARHLRQLIERRPVRAPRQASQFAKGPDDPDVIRNTEYWKQALADAPRTYRAPEPDSAEAVWVTQHRLTPDEVRSVKAACTRLGVSPHAVWVTALSIAIGALSGCHRHVCKTTYANRRTTADFNAVVQIAQPVFPHIAGSDRDTLSSRTRAVENALAEGRSHSLYDANALLDWLNPPANAGGASVQPVFEVNFVPAVDRHEAQAPQAPTPDGTWVERTRIAPNSAKPRIVLLVRHPGPVVRLSVRRPLDEVRRPRRLLDGCLRTIEAIAQDPQATLAGLEISWQ